MSSGLPQPNVRALNLQRDRVLADKCADLLRLIVAEDRFELIKRNLVVM